MKTILPKISKACFLLVFSIASVPKLVLAQAPELSFSNPVLISGTDNKQGAVYRFSNVTTGVDAELKLKKCQCLKNVDRFQIGFCVFVFSFYVKIIIVLFEVLIWVLSEYSYLSES